MVRAAPGTTHSGKLGVEQREDGVGALDDLRRIDRGAEHGDEERRRAAGGDETRPPTAIPHRRCACVILEQPSGSVGRLREIDQRGASLSQAVVLLLLTLGHPSLYDEKGVLQDRCCLLRQLASPRMGVESTRQPPNFLDDRAQSVRVIG